MKKCTTEMIAPWVSFHDESKCLPGQAPVVQMKRIPPVLFAWLLRFSIALVPSCGQ